MSEGQVRFWLNDQLVEDASLPGTTTLLRYLRDRRGLAGTKEGCAEGDCGACTVAVLEPRPDGVGGVWRAVNSCLVFLPMLQGKRVVTVEGLREQAAGPGGARAAGVDGLHPAQLAMVEQRGSQCGYCTPGIVMSLFEACYRDDMREDWQLDDQLCGNLCRCTGYRPIREAGRSVAGTAPADRFRAEARQLRPAPAGATVHAKTELSGEQIYEQPASWEALWAARARWPDAPLVAGGTDLALEVTKRHRHLPVVIGLEALEELRRVTSDRAGWEVGAGVDLTRLMDEVGAEIPALRKHLRVFGSRQIRNRATVGGNLMTASPIGDMAPVLVALGAVAVIAGPAGRREVPLDEFFLGYRRTVVAPPEILAAVRLPRPGPEDLVGAYKVSKRRELDISTVAAGMRVRLVDGRVAAVTVAFGGMSAVPAARARAVEAALLGGPWTLDRVEAAAALVADDLRPISDLRGSAEYRATLARNLLIGFFLETTSGGDAMDPWPVQLADDARTEAS